MLFMVNLILLCNVRSRLMAERGLPPPFRDSPENTERALSGKGILRILGI